MSGQRPSGRRALAAGAAAAATAVLTACAGPPPASLGLHDGRLAACPSSPNCVSTEASDARHAIEPFVLAMPAREAWAAVPDVVASLPGAEVVAVTDDYLHAECTTPLMRFVDDLELELVPGGGRIEVRSASRTGWSDLGANRERVWELRQALAKRGIIR